jgi:hypothetical protein
MVFFFWGSFAPHFQIKLSIHGSNLNSTFIIMSEIKLILLMGVLTQNFNTMDLVKFLLKNQKLHILKMYYKTTNNLKTKKLPDPLYLLIPCLYSALGIAAKWHMFWEPMFPEFFGVLFWSHLLRSGSLKKCSFLSLMITIFWEPLPCFVNAERSSTCISI